jgi:transcriptional regulator with GAF, ATPase, and Fis domain
MLEIFSTLLLIADSDCIVLIEGATGTGKELLAKAVHNNSPKKNAILQALQRNNWKKAVTAKELGIDKNTLRRKIIRYSIEVK